MRKSISRRLLEATFGLLMAGACVMFAYPPLPDAGPASTSK